MYPNRNIFPLLRGKSGGEVFDHTIQYPSGLHHVRHPLLFVVAILSLVGCSPWRTGAEKNVVKNGISFEAIRELEDGGKEII
jgi:hypothetical protein